MFDNIGRVHLPVPHLGPVSFQLQANKCHPSIIAIHANELKQMLKEESKATCIILSEGGADFSAKNIVNSIFHYRLFKELNCDMLSVSAYGARKEKEFSLFEKALSNLHFYWKDLEFDENLFRMQWRLISLSS